MEEIWKDIEGYEGFYQVSNLGGIKSIDRIASDGRGTYPLRGRGINQVIQSNGYGMLTLCKNGIRKPILCHRLVAIAFIPNPEKLPFVNHKNGIKHDNRAGNLEWVSIRENQAHARMILRSNKKRGKRHGISYRAKSKRWETKLCLNSKIIYLGAFKTEEEAHERYQKALIEYGLENRYAA